MKLLDRLILADVVPLFAGAVLIFTSIVLIISSTTLIALLGSGLPLSIVLELIGLNVLPWLIATFPMAMLIASILAFVRLSAESEATALLASGISFRRMLVPVIGFSVLVTLVSLLSNDTVAPFANRRYDAIKADVGKNLFPSSTAFDLPAIRDKNTRRLLFTAHVEGGYTAQDRALHDVTIVQYDPASGQVVATYHALTARWLGGPNVTLFNPTIASYSANQSIVMTAPEVSTMDLQQTPESVSLIATDPDSLDFVQLYNKIEELKRSHTLDEKTIRNAEVTLWFKVALPCASLVFGLVGAPLGLRPERAASRQSAIGFGLLIILCYYAFFEYMKALGSSGIVAPIFAAFAANILGLFAGVYLIRKAAS